MSEPLRWLDGAAPPGATALLRAGLAERPSRHSLQRTLVAAGATAVASTAMGGALGATVTPVVFVAKCAAIGVVSASLILGTAIGVNQYRHRAAAVPAASSTAVEHRSGAGLVPTRLAAAATPATVDVVEGAALPGSDSETSAATPRKVLDRVPPAVAPPKHVVAVLPENAESSRPEAPAASAPVPPELVVAEEVNFIDAARLRLRSGDPSGALQRINEYDRRADFGRFAPEALYLRMEAQLQLGNRLAAVNAAREMVARFPRAPQVRRAQEILDGAAGR